MRTIKAQITTIKESWAWNHKQLIIIMGLIAGIFLYQASYYIPKAEAVIYTAPQEVCETLKCLIDARTEEVFKDMEPAYREQARIQAIGQLYLKLEQELETGQLIDAEALLAEMQK